MVTQRNSDHNNEASLNDDQGGSKDHLLATGCSSIIGSTVQWLPCVCILAISCLFLFEKPTDMRAPIILPLANAVSFATLPAEPLQQRRLAELRAETLKDPSCFWSFVKYHPSELEMEWIKDIKINQEGNVCTRFTQNYKKFFDTYVAEIPKLTPNAAPALHEQQPTKCEDLDVTYKAPLELPHSVFSRFEYKWVCNSSAQEDTRDHRFVYIEPLAGILRHPLACESMGRNLLRKDYMVVDAWAVHNAFNAIPTIPTSLLSESIQLVSPPRAYYFDLGASTWTSGAGGASQPWFCGIFQDMCIRFDEIYAWEVQKIDAVQVMKVLPGPIKPKYHWYNVPAATAEGDWDNPLTTLLSETRPDDFVIFKLDVDNWQVEEAFISQILASPELQSRIDEMFWEHHVTFQPMAGCCWGRAVHAAFKQEDSLKLFGALRNTGIRIHSWV